MLGDKLATSAPRTLRSREEFRGIYASAPKCRHLPTDQPFERSRRRAHQASRHNRLDEHARMLRRGLHAVPARPASRSGRHRHMWEEIIFVAEGAGYDLHWDLKFDCVDAVRLGLGGRTKALRMEARRFHLCSAVHHPPAFCRRRHRGATHRNQQPHRQNDGIRLARPVGTCTRFLITADLLMHDRQPAA